MNEWIRNVNLKLSSGLDKILSVFEVWDSSVFFLAQRLSKIKEDDCLHDLVAADKKHVNELFVFQKLQVCPQGNLEGHFFSDWVVYFYRFISVVPFFEAYILA